MILTFLVDFAVLATGRTGRCYLTVFQTDAVYSHARINGL